MYVLLQGNKRSKIVANNLYQATFSDLLSKDNTFPFETTEHQLVHLSFRNLVRKYALKQEGYEVETGRLQSQQKDAGPANPRTHCLPGRGSIS